MVWLPNGRIMEKKNYLQVLSDEDKVRVEFSQNHGKITKFIVQYHSLVGRRWSTVMRIDNCHGIPHRHVYHLRNKEFKILLAKYSNEKKYFHKKEPCVGAPIRSLCRSQCRRACEDTQWRVCGYHGQRGRYVQSLKQGNGEEGEQRAGKGR